MNIMDSYKQDKVNFVKDLKKDNNCPLYMTMSSKNGAHIIAEGKDCINFVSNNYLGFTVHPQIAEVMKAAIDKYGVGMAGSPVMSGTTDIYNELCRKVAEIYKKPAAAVFPSGYQGMVGILPAVIGHGDVALLDSLAHRSLLDGVILSGANRFMWKHNNLENLDQLLERHQGYKRKLIVVDSVYSMDGDIADIPGIVKVKEKHNALLLTDEAHSLGVIGERGLGILDYYRENARDVDIVAGTFSKFGAVAGGFVAGSQDFIDYLRFSSSGYLFTTALPAHLCAGALKALQLLEEQPEWHMKLWENIKFLTTQLRSAGFDLGNTRSAVIPLFIRNTEKTIQFSKRCFEMGVIASPVYHPGVGKGEDRMRIGLSALHTTEDLEEAVHVFVKVGKELSII